LSFELSATPIKSFSILNYSVLNSKLKIQNSKLKIAMHVATIQNSKFKTQNSK